MERKVVLVTGASGGIGSATAERFSQEGYNVVLHCYQNREAAESLAKTFQAQGHDALVVQADLRQPTQVEQMMELIQQKYGAVDILINNAGIAQQKLFTDITDAEWRNMFAVHVDAAFYCSRAVLPAMIHQKSGCIINISSMWGQTGGSCEVHYSAAKGALQAMTKALAKEVGPSGIRVNCVAPGVIQTEMNSRMLDKETMDALREDTPLECIGTPQDVAAAVYFLATEEAGFITGQILPVNGGMVI